MGKRQKWGNINWNDERWIICFQKSVRAKTDLQGKNKIKSNDKSEKKEKGSKRFIDLWQPISRTPSSSDYQLIFLY